MIAYFTISIVIYIHVGLGWSMAVDDDSNVVYQFGYFVNSLLNGRGIEIKRKAISMLCYVLLLFVILL